MSKVRVTMSEVWSAIPEIHMLYGTATQAIPRHVLRAGDYTGQAQRGSSTEGSPRTCSAQRL